MLKSENRLPKHKNCKHNLIFMEELKGYKIFYCTKCLIYILKNDDFPVEEVIKNAKK